jgi:GT2 family glycosyltransferase
MAYAAFDAGGPAGPAALTTSRPPTVSVVICTKDRPADLVRAVASVRESGKTGQRAEIVVVEEATKPRNLADVHYVHLPPEGRGFAHARNIGFAEATGDIVAFLDDDCEAEHDWLDTLVAPFHDNPAMLGVAGAVLVRRCGQVGYAENILGFPGGGLRYLHHAGGRTVPTRHLSTCNCAYRRDAVRLAGGFPDRGHMGGEDFLLAERVSAIGPCVYTPHAIVYHRPRDRWRAVFDWFVRRGQSEILIRSAVGDRKGFTAFLLRSSWTLRCAVIFAILWHWPPFIRWLPAAAAAYYGALLWRFRFALEYPTHRRAWWIVPALKWTMDLGTELGRWKALIVRARQP